MIYHYKNKEYPPMPAPDPRPTDGGHPQEGRGWD